MHDPRETAEERRHRNGAMTIDEFRRRYGISRTKTYMEIERAGSSQREPAHGD
jgi:hypothetical protein